MASLDTIITVALTPELQKVIAEAQEDFKRLHTELTDDLKKLIAEEVAKQLAEQSIHKPAGVQRHNPVHEVK